MYNSYSDEFIDPQIIKDEISYNSDTPFFVDKTSFFTYIIIIIIFFAIFNRLTIGLNIIFGLGLAIIIIAYLNNKKVKKETDLNNILTEKKDIMRPKSDIINKYNEMVEFIFSIQEFYGFSPINFEDMIDSIEDFFILYENLLINPKFAGLYYEMAVKKKSDSLNALHNIIYSSDVVERKHYAVKIYNATNQLSFILSTYLDKINDISYRYNTTFGLNIHSKIPEKETHPKPENYYYELDQDLSKKVSFNVF